MSEILVQKQEILCAFMGFFVLSRILANFEVNMGQFLKLDHSLLVRFLQSPGNLNSQIFHLGSSASFEFLVEIAAGVTLLL